MIDLTHAQWILIIIAGIFVGLSKMGLSGVMMLIIPILAAVFGGKHSTGVILPILIIGDIMAVKYYNRHAKWLNIKRLLPWALVGLAIGILVGNFIDDRQFKMLISISILICVGILIYTEFKGQRLKTPNKLWFYSLTGIASGFATMIGNAAGPILSIYLLAMGYKKNGFLGTYAWFFLIINVIKVPLQIFFWHNIALENFILSIYMIPAVGLGAFIGAKIVKKIPEKPFRYFIIIMTTIAAIRLFI